MEEKELCPESMGSGEEAGILEVGPYYLSPIERPGEGQEWKGSWPQRPPKQGGKTGGPLNRGFLCASAKAEGWAGLPESRARLSESVALSVRKAFLMPWEGRSWNT